MNTSLKEGYIYDYISGIEVKATPEELNAVQVFSKILVEDYKYPKENIQTRPQFRVKARPSDLKIRFFSHTPDNGKQRVLPYARIGWSDYRYHSKRAAKTIHDTPGNSGGAHPNNSVSVGKILKPYRHNPIPLFLQIR